MFPTAHGVLQQGGFVGALDGAPNLVHVWCIARRWRSAHEARLVRLRRSSDQVEADFSYDADGNLDVAAVAAWAGGSAFITVIADQVGSDDVSQGTAGNQPEYVASGQNGRPISRHDGTNHWLRSTIPDFPDAATVIVGVTQTGSTNQGVLEMGTGVVNTGISVLYDGSTLYWRINAGGVIKGTSTAIALPFTQLISGTYDAALAELFLNGVSKGTLATPGTLTNTITTIDLGRIPVSSHYLQGDLMTTVIADEVLSATNRQAVEAALDDYWNIIP